MFLNNSMDTCYKADIVKAWSKNSKWKDTTLATASDASRARC